MHRPGQMDQGIARFMQAKFPNRVREGKAAYPQDGSSPGSQGSFNVRDSPDAYLRLPIMAE